MVGAHCKVLFISSIDPKKLTFVLSQIDGLVSRGFKVKVICRLPYHGQIHEVNICNGFVGKKYSRINIFAWLFYFKLRAIFDARYSKYIDGEADWKLYGRFVGTRRAIPWDSLSRFAKSWRPDVIHVHFAWHLPYAIPFAEYLGVPIVCTVHGSDIYLEDDWKDYLICENVKQILCVSTEMRRYIVDILPELSNKTSVLYNAIDQVFFGPAVPPPKEFRIIHIAGFRPVKNHDYLLSALRVLKQRGIDFTCVLVGDGDEKGRILELVESYGLVDSIQLLGWLSSEEVCTELDRSTVSVLVSKSEGLPTVLAESMSRQRAIVYSDLKGAVEVAGMGRYGSRVSLSDPESLAEELLKAHQITLRQNEDLVEAREYILDRFGIEEHIASLSSLYNSLR